MRRFLYQILLFITPILLAAGIKEILFEKSGGDLSRIGVLSVSSDYRKIFTHDFNQKKEYINFSENNQLEDSTINVLLIGDSFSRQKNYGYRNFLAQHPSISVVYYDLLKSGDNPLDILNQLSNGDFFDHYQFDYVILGSVERSATQRARIELEKDTLSVDEISQTVDAQLHQAKNENEGFKEKVNTYFTYLVLYYQHQILYHFDDNAINSQVYKLQTQELLFSNDQEILIYDEDIQSARLHSGQKALYHLNEQLNAVSQKLTNKGVGLVFVPAADKYEFYYDQIINKDEYPRPQFFETLKPLDKSYDYLDSKALLTPLLSQRVRDIYFYDDTHWSPIAAKAVATELRNMITKSQNNGD